MSPDSTPARQEREFVEQNYNIDTLTRRMERSYEDMLVREDKKNGLSLSRKAVV